MKYEYLKRYNAEQLFKKLTEDVNAEALESNLNKDYLEIREDLLTVYKSIDMSSPYKFDLMFGIELYDYFQMFDDFTETLASNYDFWRYLSLKVVPEIIIKRHGLVSEYFYSKNVRIYLSALWWYIHLCWQGTKERTIECLNDLSTDYILQLTERPGKTGVYLEITRKIMRKIHQLTPKERNKKIGGAVLFRRIMILNHTMIENYNLLMESNEDEYVNLLFERCM